jgi:ribonuclease VapC
MVIDTSALAAIVFDEPDAEEYEAPIDADPTRLLSCASWLGTSIVVEARFGERGAREFDLLLRRVPFEIVRIPFRLYGRGRHKAPLNFGDGFALTDVKSALRRRSR